MRYTGVALLLVLAACSSDDGADSPTGQPSNDPVTEPGSVDPAPSTMAEERYLIVSTTPDLRPDHVLGLTEGGLEGSSSPSPVYWSFDEAVDIEYGDVIELVDTSNMCAESYPPLCSARTATVVTSAEELGLVTFGT